MSIFRRDSPPPRPAAPGPVAPGEPAPGPRHEGREGRATHIAPGTRVRGEVTGEAELIVDGEIEGEVRVEGTVVVGPGGVVRGPISAQVVRVGGKVEGDVRGSDRVELGPAGSLEGNIAAPRVVLAEGAFFKGQVEMQGDKTRGERQPPAGAAAERAKGE